MRFLEEAQLAKLNPRQRARYEHNLKVYRDNRVVDHFLEERGFEKGKAEGKAEEATRIAERLLLEQIPFNVILKTTGLDFDTLHELKRRLEL